MQVVTVNLPDLFVDEIDRARDFGECASRSEFIRNAIDEYLKITLLLVEAMLNSKSIEVEMQNDRGDDDGESKSGRINKIDMRSPTESLEKSIREFLKKEENQGS